MRKLLLSACLAAAAFWINDAGAMNGYLDDYSSKENSIEHEIYEGEELDISSSGDERTLPVQYLIQHVEFPDVETLTADLRSAFKMIYRSPVATCAVKEQSLIRWNRFPKVKELTLKLDGEFEEVRRSLCETLLCDFGLYIEITEIPRIDTLEELNLSNLHIAAIPESIQNLRNLKLLDLSGNSLKELPQSIGNLTNLEHLYLGTNEDSEDCNSLEILPESIGNLTNLETLDLTGCSLRELPESIGNLKNLEMLVLDSNLLIDLPNSIGNLVNLETLDLTDCSLQRIPESIGNLINLENFLLDDYIILPPTVRNLKKLEPSRLEELEEQIED
ncbi:MAG: hypothetical protein J6T29_02015 [Alphaproteobacteria bacterium]|nr:hypothetical protein [Alphaproteobacteria bacterium]